MIRGFYPRPADGAVDPEQEILRQIQQGSAPDDLKLAVSSGIFPLSPQVIHRVLFFLAHDRNPVVRDAAEQTVRDMPEVSFYNVVRDVRTPVDFLAFIARLRSDVELMTQIIAAPHVTTRIILKILDNASPKLLERIANNQDLLLRSPAIIDALLKHPQSPTLVKIRTRELAEQFHAVIEEARRQEAVELERQTGENLARSQLHLKQSSVNQVELQLDETQKRNHTGQVKPSQAPMIPASQPPSTSRIAELHSSVSGVPERDLQSQHPVLQQPMQVPGFSLLDDDDEIDIMDSDLPGMVAQTIRSASQQPEYDDEESDSYYDEENEDEIMLDTRLRLMKLSVAERLLVAQMGTKQERAVLVRDGNKKIALAAIQSPKITEFEVEQVSKLRSVSEDILREIANNREWAKSYPVINALVHNPKTPTGISLRLLSRIRDQDLKDLSKDKEVGYAIRAAAQRLHELRESRRSGGAKKAGK